MRYTIKQLSSIFRCSKKQTVSYLQSFGIPLNQKERFTTTVSTTQLQANKALYQSILLSSSTRKPFYTVKDLLKLLIYYKHNHPTLYTTTQGIRSFLKRRSIPTTTCSSTRSRKHFIIFLYDISLLHSANN